MFADLQAWKEVSFLSFPSVQWKSLDIMHKTNTRRPKVRRKAGQQGNRGPGTTQCGAGSFLVSSAEGGGLLSLNRFTDNTIPIKKEREKNKDWEKIFGNHIAHQGLFSKTYKGLSKLNKNPVKMRTIHEQTLHWTAYRDGKKAPEEIFSIINV